MKPIGYVCQRNRDVHSNRWTRVTQEEQLTLMSLWALAPSPLRLVANPTDNDEWTTAVLSHPEVLAVNQDALGLQGKKQGVTPSGAEIWSKQLADGSLAVASFNRTEKPLTQDYAWSHPGFAKATQVRDVWLRKDLSAQENFAAELPPHGCALVRVSQ